MENPQHNWHKPEEAPWLTGSPVREGTTVTDDRPEDTTVTGGVVVGAMVEMQDIMHYKKCTRMNMWTAEELMCPPNLPK